MRSIVRRDTGESYEEFLRKLAQESGISTPTREQLAKLDRKRPKKGSNEEWMNPHDPEAEITKMKDGSTHFAYKAEHAVDLETGAVVAVNLARGAAGDTETILETLPLAGENLTQVSTVTNPQQVGSDGVPADGPEQVVADKGYHSNHTLETLAKAEVRTYISEPQRGRRRWEGKAEAQEAVYGNRRRIGGERGKELLRKRGEFLERSFAHAYETGGMRRLHLRGRENILKRILIHLGGFNLSLVMRELLGKGTPRGCQGFSADQVLVYWRLCIALLAGYSLESASRTPPISSDAPCADLSTPLLLEGQEVSSATDC